MIEPKIYIAKATKNSDGTFTAEKEVEIQEYFSGAKYNAVDGLEVEYFSIVDGDTLLDVENWEDSKNIVGCITVYCGKKPIRLIDHIKYNS